MYITKYFKKSEELKFALTLEKTPNQNHRTLQDCGKVQLQIYAASLSLCKRLNKKLDQKPWSALHVEANCAGWAHLY